MGEDKLSESRCFNLGIEYGSVETLLKRRFSLISTIALFSVLISFFFAATVISGSAATLQCSLEGYTLEPQETWTSGNVNGWSAEDCVPFRYTVENKGEASDSFNSKITFDHIRNGITGIEDFEDITVPAGTIDGPYYEDDDPGRIVGYYWWNATWLEKGEYILTWCARLSNETGLWPGASVHVSAENGGSRDVPIMTGVTEVGYSISGKKFNDADYDGKYNNEPGIGGWTIELVQDGDVICSTMTDMDGVYTFDDLPPGTYTVREVQDPLWFQMCPSTGTYVIDLTGGDVTDMNFGNVVTL